jgi:hypothetical protein
MTSYDDDTKNSTHGFQRGFVIRAPKAGYHKGMVWSSTFNDFNMGATISGADLSTIFALPPLLLHLQGIGLGDETV